MPPAAVAAQIAQRALMLTLTGRLVPQDRLHLTLAFLGRMDRPGMDTALAAGDMIRERAFCLRVDRLGCFDSPGMNWLAPDKPPAALLDLSSKLYKNTQTDNTRWAYRPHITITRKADGLVTRRVEPITWHVTHFSLIASGTSGRPGVYRELRRWPLLSAPVDTSQV